MDLEKLPIMLVKLSIIMKISYMADVVRGLPKKSMDFNG